MTINNKTNIEMQINVQNNINLVSYDKIKYDYMDLDVVKRLFEVPGEALPAMTLITFFNPNNEENHVIFCPNLKDTQIYIYNKNQFSPDGWSIVEKKEFFEEMMRKQLFTLVKIKNCNDEEDNPLEINDYTGFNNLIRELNSNKAVKKEYITKLNNLCYQNKDIVKNTREKLQDLKRLKNKQIK